MSFGYEYLFFLSFPLLIITFVWFLWSEGSADTVDVGVDGRIANSSDDVILEIEEYSDSEDDSDEVHEEFYVEDDGVFLNAANPAEFELPELQFQQGQNEGPLRLHKLTRRLCAANFS
ncbi:uncharacterized protein LOC105208724 isoform X2 [Zeugodacus cucurbitae]|uniref:S-adenosylmethionine synthase n=1 Tax=Zeugodacus cucurbitae TaxID=28588 RepID=A0A0A1XB29_ZEUCU|nr:uncharacterized protein LOC105208724 isoform X2 [Zeugodacus cucurbitae]